MWKQNVQFGFHMSCKASALVSIEIIVSSAHRASYPYHWRSMEILHAFVQSKLCLNLCHFIESAWICEKLEKLEKCLTFLEKVLINMINFKICFGGDIKSFIRINTASIKERAIHSYGAWPLQGHGVARWSNKDAWKTSWKMLKKCFNKLSWDLWALQCSCLIMRQMRLYHGPKAKLMRFYSEENVCVQVILEVWEVKFYFINPK